MCVFTLGASAQDAFDFQNQKSEEIPGFKIYPNPAFTDVVNVITRDNHLKQVRVYDVFGEIVLSEKISRSNLNISGLVPGVYVLQVTENKKTSNRKLVIK
ncbi:T9SS type A sorting domain-containing protein [Zobellia galactanivorans]|uniref:Por secretion system C-terminal sorting domain-containing protein n=2 Tax=Zobellia TaxID=112040 RepID=A0ABY1KMX8_9FLAO|nr:T9SS type A sorting domain-containing protein [Zobellia galactanivorans]SIS41133.1 Por secretion system C-terminal sorting domain-containing protein [Zobellia uliginosa]